MIEGIDYASPGISPASIVAAGKHFVGRYLSDHHGDPYGLLQPEAQGLLDAGLDIVLLWEIGADRAAGGAPAGTADGQAAAYQLAALGAPADATVYFVCQDDGTPPSLASIDAYLRAASSALGRDVGAYAGGTILAHIKSVGSAKYLWRAAATSWGPAPAGTHLIQYATGSTTPPAPPIDGHAVDLDQATVADFGQWRAAMPIYTVGGVRTGVVAANTPYYTNPGDAKPRASTTTTATYLLTAFDATGKWVALDGNYGKTPATPVMCGWVPLTAVSSIAPYPAPVPPQTVTVTGQGIKVTGP